MRTHTKLVARTVLLSATAWLAGCNGTIDSEPNVVLEVETLTIPPISGTRDATTGACILNVVNATASLKNRPKNSLAGTSPFNDIVLQDLVVGYVWDDGNGVTAAQFGVGGTVPAAGSASAQFAVVNAQDLSLPVPREGHTASLTLTFRGVTISGEPVTASTGGTLTINTCQ